MYSKEIKLASGLMGKYYQYFIDKEHPLAYSNGAVYYHRHVASIKLGRWLEHDEIAHHVDENKVNNNPGNIEILSEIEHKRKHTETISGITDFCGNCSKELFLRAFEFNKRNYCSNTCRSLDSIKDKTITKEILEELMPKLSWRELGSIFNYSDTGIKKRAKSLGCNMSLAKNKQKRNICA